MFLNKNNLFILFVSSHWRNLTGGFWTGCHSCSLYVIFLFLEIFVMLLSPSNLAFFLYTDILCFVFVLMAAKHVYQVKSFPLPFNYLWIWVVILNCSIDCLLDDWLRKRNVPVDSLFSKNNYMKKHGRLVLNCVKKFLLSLQFNRNFVVGHLGALGAQLKQQEASIFLWKVLIK